MNDPIARAWGQNVIEHVDAFLAQTSNSSGTNGHGHHALTYLEINPCLEVYPCLEIYPH